MKKAKTTIKTEAGREKAVPESLTDFERRLNRHHDELQWLYRELYHNDEGAFRYFLEMPAGAGGSGRRTCAARTRSGRRTPTGTAAGSCWG